MGEAFAEAVPSPAGENAPAVEAILEQVLGQIVVGTDLSAEEIVAEFQPQSDATRE